MATDRRRFLPSPVLSEDQSDGWTRPTRDLAFFKPAPGSTRMPSTAEAEPEAEREADRRDGDAA